MVSVLRLKCNDHWVVRNMNNHVCGGVHWNIQPNPFVPYNCVSELRSLYYVQDMLTFPVKRIAALLIVLHLVAVAGSQWGHDHVLTAVFHSVHKLQTHDCGSSERHKPLELNHQCLPCLRNSNSLGYVEQSLNAPVEAISILPLNLEQSLRSSGFDLSSTERGPPLAA